jgi:hypothetical protein
MVLVPDTIGIPEIDHEVVPAAVPLPPPLFTQVISVTPTSSEAVPLILSADALVAYVVDVVGELIFITGAVLSDVQVTLKVAAAALPAASFAVMVIVFAPEANVTPRIDQDVVPVAVPLPPLLLDHVT